MKTLIIAAHCDDEVLSTGGLIRKRVLQHGASSVAVTVMFGRKYPKASRAEQRKLDREQMVCFGKAKDILGYRWYGCQNLEEGEPGGYYEALDIVEDRLASFQPDEVVIPGAGDLNQDHRFLAEIGRIALRPANRGRVKRVLEAMAHDTYAGPQQATYGVPMNGHAVNTVIYAMNQYEREMRAGPHPRAIENMVARWRVYGAQFGVEFAEPYKMLIGLD